MNSYRRGARVRMTEEWLQHPLRDLRRHSRAYYPGVDDVGTVIGIRRLEGDVDCLVVWDRDPKKRRTRFAEFWLQDADVVAAIR